MTLPSARLLVPVAAAVIAWGGVHLLSSHDLAVTPAVWPVPATGASSTPVAGALAPILPTGPAASPSAGSATDIPVLPGALRQLNNSTRDTAVGLYALIQQLEAALRTHIEQLAQQLEPGR